MKKYRIAVFSLNQWALDFTGNCHRILESIRMASHVGANIRVGPELEICGYSCEDALFELDTVLHSWEVIQKIIDYPESKDIIIDVGMPVLKNSTRYNCRIIIYNRRILLIRPKTRLAMNGNYRESRHFTAWQHDSGLVWYRLPSIITQLTGQKWAPFGSSSILQISQPSNFSSISEDITTFRIGFEICQEMWDYDALNVEFYGRHGCHLIVNSSASYWELRKLDTLQSLIKSATLKNGGAYVFSNLIGCDGQRLCFYGRSCVYINGQLKQMTPINENVMQEIQMCHYDVDASTVDQYRSQLAIRIEPHQVNGAILNLTSSLVFNNSNDFEPVLDISKVRTLHLENLCLKKNNIEKCYIEYLNVDMNITKILRAEEEIYLYGSLWLWDYLRRSSMMGFIVPLSGGLDSSAVVCLVYSMCIMLAQQIKQQNSTVLEFFKDKHAIPCEKIEEHLRTPRDVCNLVLRCFYLSTRYSGCGTLKRAQNLCFAIGCKFSNFNFQPHYQSIRSSLLQILNQAQGKKEQMYDDETVTLLDQNLQARLRMTSIYYLSEGRRIVLATGNVDEALMGYLTKYDCSSADINPIGGICKRDLHTFMQYCRKNFKSDHFRCDNHDVKGEECAKIFVEVVEEICNAPPSAELTGSDQLDEVDIGLTYNEIAYLGRTRRGQYGCFGPFYMFQTLWQRRDEPELRVALSGEWNDPRVLADKVKIFFTRFARNRHKLTVLTPALHAETYSPDDNRFDHRPFLMNSRWTWQFQRIDEQVERLKAEIASNN